MSGSLSNIVGKALRRSAGLALCLGLLAAPALAAPDLNLKGVIDFHVHSGPDTVKRSIDTDDLARLAKKSGMRGLVLKSHTQPTAGIAYMARKAAPGLEVFGGITMDLSNGGINVEAVKNMLLMTGGLGKVVWLPTHNAENDASRRTGIASIVIARDGKLMPNVVELIDFIAQHPELVLETGHISAEEVLLVTREAKLKGVKHVVVTHAMYYVENMSIPQMKQAAADGAYLEFCADGPHVGPQPRRTVAEYAEAIRQVGPQHVILSTNFGSVRNPPDPMHPKGMLDFMNALHKEGLSVADINMITKTNPALALGLKP